MLGASVGELSFGGLLLVLVLLAQIAPRIGEVIGARLGAAPALPPGPDGGGSTPPRA